jgi:hypothetical protein
MHGIESELSQSVSIHTFIISWPGFGAKALKIENSLSQRTGKVQVIHSPGDSSDFEAPPHWVILPNEAFYGAKFVKSLELCASDVMLQIQADAHCDNWADIAESCESAFADNQDLGLWAPLVDWTPWSLARTSLEKPKKPPPRGFQWWTGLSGLSAPKPLNA